MLTASEVANGQKTKAEQRLAEIVSLLAEREREAKKLQSIDKRIAEIAGIIPENKMRKSRKQTFSAEEFVRGCQI